MRVALKIEHRVHHVLQHAGPGQRALFGHMAHQHHGGATGLGRAREVRRTLAHLGHRTGGRGELVRVHSLNRVNHRNAGPHGRERGQNFFEVNFGQHPNLASGHAQTPRPQGHLGATFFATDVQSGSAPALQHIQRLQQQGRLANTRVAANQHHTTGYHAPAQHAVELVYAGGGTVDFRGFNVE